MPLGSFALRSLSCSAEHPHQAVLGDLLGMKAFEARARGVYPSAATAQSQEDDYTQRGPDEHRHEGSDERIERRPVRPRRQARGVWRGFAVASRAGAGVAGHR